MGVGLLTSIWKARGVTLETKVKLVKVLVFPVVRFRVSWMERKTNISIIENIKPEWTLESSVTNVALSYFGHVVSAGGMEDDVMLGRMNEARTRGRPRQI